MRRLRRPCTPKRATTRPTSSGAPSSPTCTCRTPNILRSISAGCMISRLSPRPRHCKLPTGLEDGVMAVTCRLVVACGLLMWSAHPALRAQAQAVVAPRDAGSPWVGRTTEIESQLKAAEIVSIEDVGTGVTRPRRAHIRPSAPVESLAWKVLPPGRRSGYWESYKSEIAAYELDKLLGMNMVPPAV